MAESKRIAFMVDYLGTASFQQELMSGIMNALPKQGVQLYILLGGGLFRADNDEYAQYRNCIYELISKKVFDGILVSTTLGNFASPAEVEEYFKRFKELPVIFLGPGPKKYYQILVNNSQGMEDIVHHFIHDHQYKRTAFITGSSGNKDAEERLEAYKTQLEEAGIEVDPQLIYNGNFTLESGIAAVKTLLDERKVSFDSLVASNDNMALGAKQEIERRGLSVPDDIAVSGFDDIVEASSVRPGITTAKQPFDQFGKKVFENFERLFRGQAVQAIEYIPAQPVVRQSCGCFSGTIKDTKHSYDNAVEADVHSYYNEHKQEYLMRILESTAAAELQLDRNETGLLLDALYQYIFVDQENSIFTVIRNTIMKTFREKREVERWHDILTLIRYLFSPLFTEREIIAGAENIFHKTRLLISETQITQNKQQFINERNSNDQIIWVGEGLANAVENKTLREFIYSSFPPLQINNFLFAEFTETEGNIEMARLIALIRNGQTLEIDEEGITFPSKDIFPPKLTLGGCGIYFVIPLIFREHKLGYVIFEKSAGQQTMYGSLSSQLGRSLYTSRLISRILATEKVIQEHSDRIESLIRPMIDSIQKVRKLSESQASEALNLNTITRQSEEKIGQSKKIAQDLSKILSETNLLVDSINDISETVDILSLNASIEAVHAGSSGRGFSVIATEIRNLSDKTKHNLQQINKFLSAVSGGIKNFVTVNQEVGRVFGNLHRTIDDMSASLRVVSEKMMQLGETSNSILAIMRQNETETSS
jgi:DNA-binding LacI/PurR family transcriptional regulator